MLTLNSLADAGINFCQDFDGMDLSKMVEDEKGPYRKEVEQIDQFAHPTALISGIYKLVNSTYDIVDLATFLYFGGNPDSWLVGYK